MSNSLKKLLTEFKYLEQNSINVKKGSIFLALSAKISSILNVVKSTFLYCQSACRYFIEISESLPISPFDSKYSTGY